MISLINLITFSSAAALRHARDARRRRGSPRNLALARVLWLVPALMLVVMTAGCSDGKPTVSRESGKVIHDYCDKSDAAARAVVKQLEAAGVLDPGAGLCSEAQRNIRPSSKPDVYLRWNLATYDAPLWSGSADLLSYVVSRAVRKAGATLASPVNASDAFVFSIGFSDRSLRGLAESLEVVRLVVPFHLADEIREESRHATRDAGDPAWDVGHDANASIPAGTGTMSVVHENGPEVYQDLVGGEKPDKPEEYVPKEEPLAAAGPEQASRARARLAIVIDDLGNGVDGTEQLFRIEAPITVAVLPEGGRAGSEATIAGERGFAVLLHQPMEPHDPAKHPGRGAIMAGMGEEEIRRVLAANLAVVPNAIGVSNHMGSRVTEDRGAMSTIMDEVLSRGLFFFDSRTTPNSAAPRVARDMGAPLLENARFLDHIADEEYVVDQIRAAARIAMSRGAAAVIGHVRPATVRALARMIPELEIAGIQLVRLDELMPAEPASAEQLAPGAEQDDDRGAQAETAPESTGAPSDADASTPSEPATDMSPDDGGM